MKRRSCSYEALEVCFYKAYVWDVSEYFVINWGEGRFYADFTWSVHDWFQKLDLDLWR
jgi:hypothetical protein